MPVSQAARKIMAGKVDIPPMPVVMQKVMNKMRDPQVAIANIAELIGTDPALAAQILKIANSPFYGLAREVSTIRQAVVVLGMRTVRGQVVGGSSKTLYKEVDPIDQGLWEHSMATAICAHTLAKAKRLGSQDEAFVAGLMHDVGKVVLLNTVREDYVQVIDEAKASGRYSFEVEQEKLGLTHMDVGAALVEEWNLAESLLSVALYHHDVDEAAAEVPDDLELVSLVNLSNLICNSLGIGLFSGGSPPDWDEEPALSELGIEPGEVDDITEEVKAVYEQEKGVFA